MLNRLTSVSTRGPWLVIGLWVALLVSGALVGQAKLYDVTTNDTAGFLPRSYEPPAPSTSDRRTSGS